MKKTVLILALVAVCLVACKKETENGEIDDNNVIYTPTDTRVLTENGIEDGAVVGTFSVSNTTKVRFSRGNLQYRAKDHVWRFANNQYDIMGESNTHISESYAGWIDLFGWGTSGASVSLPTLTTTDNSYYAEEVTTLRQNKYDWGYFNAISNGGGRAELWRTLSDQEWHYVTELRPNASQLSAFATVMEVPGLLLLPDDWNCPAGLSVSVGNNRFDVNVYDANAWIRMQGAGAVFLPTAGERTETSIAYQGTYGCYWTSEASGSDFAQFMEFHNHALPILTFGYRCVARAVRLVCDEQ